MSQKLKSISIAGQKFDIDAGASTPMFSEVVSIEAPPNGVVDLSEHNFKTIKLALGGLQDSPNITLTLPLYCIVIFDNFVDMTSGYLDLVLGTPFNGLAGLKFPTGYYIEESVCSSGTMRFSVISPGTFEHNTIFRMNNFITLSQAIEL